MADREGFEKNLPVSGGWGNPSISSPIRSIYDTYKFFRGADPSKTLWQNHPSFSMRKKQSKLLNIIRSAWVKPITLEYCIFGLGISARSVSTVY